MSGIVAQALREIERTEAAARKLDTEKEQPRTNGHDGSTDTSWPEPTPLPKGFSSVEQFDYDLLPQAFRPWIQDIAERMQCPPDYPAISAMVALASLVGRQVTIRPKRHDDWTVVPNLYGGIVGPPGVLKSPALKEPMSAIYRFQSDAMQQHESNSEVFAAAEIVYQERVKLERQTVKEDLSKKCPINAQSNAEDLIAAQPKAPVCKRYIVNDTTVERLQEILSENPNGVLQFRDELTGFLKQMEKTGHETDRAFFLEAWNGDSSFTSDRIGRGMTHIESACLSLIGGIQPGPLQSYFAGIAHGGGGNDGLLQRFQLLVYPDISSEWENIDRVPDKAARDGAFAVFDRLKDIQSGSTDYDEGAQYLRFSDDAQEMFDKWRAKLETRLRSGDEPPAIDAHLSKYRSLVPSLALLIHLANDESGSVGYDCVKAAIAWAKYLESHAHRIYAPVLNPDMEFARALATKIKQGKLGQEFTIKDVYGPHWSNLTNSGQARTAVDILIDYDWLTAKTESTAGAPKTTYFVNPNVQGEL